MLKIIMNYLFCAYTLSYLSKKKFSLKTMICHLESDAELDMKWQSGFRN